MLDANNLVESKLNRQDPCLRRMHSRGEGTILNNHTHNKYYRF